MDTGSNFLGPCRCASTFGLLRPIGVARPRGAAFNAAQVPPSRPNRFALALYHRTQGFMEEGRSVQRAGKSGGLLQQLAVETDGGSPGERAER
jgi:hypothetical protein